MQTVLGERTFVFIVPKVCVWLVYTLCNYFGKLHNAETTMCVCSTAHYQQVESDLIKEFQDAHYQGDVMRMKACAETLLPFKVHYIAYLCL